MVRTKLNKQQIFELITAIPDPEIPVITIQDLGILRSVNLTDENCVITITPTYTGCPAMGMLEEQIREKLGGKGIENVTIELVYKPAWTTDWLSESTREKLHKYGISPPQKIKCHAETHGMLEMVRCPLCNSSNTDLISKFGSTACKALYKCSACKEPFEHFKCH